MEFARGSQSRVIAFSRRSNVTRKASRSASKAERGTHTGSPSFTSQREKSSGQALITLGRMRHQDAFALGALDFGVHRRRVRRWRFGLPQAPFFRAARTKSSTPALGPRAA